MKLNGSNLDYETNCQIQTILNLSTSCSNAKRDSAFGKIFHSNKSEKMEISEENITIWVIKKNIE